MFAKMCIVGLIVVSMGGWLYLLLKMSLWAIHVIYS